jgi:hypothetical protein
MVQASEKERKNEWKNKYWMGQDCLVLRDELPL